MVDNHKYTDWLEIDLSALHHNLRRLGEITARPVMAVVKGNGYGHGAAPVARAFLEAGAAWLGVARIEEAMALRQAGIDAPVLVLGYSRPDMVPAAIENHITLAVGDEDVAAAYAAKASRANPLAVHAKIDSGMGRLGVLPEMGASFVRGLYARPELMVDGIFTHFARADEPGYEVTARQLARFCEVLDALDAEGVRPRLVHAANSAASLYHPNTYFDLVRPGVALYGLNPSPEAPVPADFRTALTWKTCLVSVKMLPAGHGVSYGHHYITPAVQRMGVIAVGYADGMRRIMKVNSVLIGGQKLPVVGSLCMDQGMVPLDSLPEARVGDEVVLIGRQGDQQILADDLAAAWGTINYEVTCGLGARIPRLYLD